MSKIHGSREKKKGNRTQTGEKMTRKLPVLIRKEHLHEILYIYLYIYIFIYIYIYIYLYIYI